VPAVTTPIHADLITLLDAVEIVSPGRYTFLGETCDVPTEVPAGEPEGGPLVSDLAARLYAKLYIRPREAGISKDDGGITRLDFLAALSAANTGRGTWEAGWTIRRTDALGRVAVSRNELSLWTTTTDLRAPSGRIEPGELCRVRAPKEIRHLVPGYYLALGDAEVDESNSGHDHEAEPEPQLRYYWHLTGAIAAEFVATATTHLNARSIPFRLKVLSDPAAYTRADAGVLYVSRRFAHDLGEIIARIHQPIASGLRPETPLLTRRLADGLAVAEAPADAGSFGERRCELVARSLWRSFLQGSAGREARTAMLVASIGLEGLDAQHPYLGPRSTLAGLQPALPLLGRRTESADTAPAAAAGSDAGGDSSMTPLDAAILIGQSLVQTAHWDSDRRLCNWMGRSAGEVAPGAPIVPTTSALGPDLYAGSAGIAWFLAQLHAITGDPACRLTALGAIARSIRQLHRRPADAGHPLSFFLGHLGVSCTAQRVGVLTGEAGLDAQAEAIIDRLAGTFHTPHPLDLLGGNAGAILALLAMSRTATRTGGLELATALGEELCQKSRQQGVVWSWAPEIATGPGTASRPLTGLGHGASGIGLALIELYAVTGRPDWLEAARGAFAYEDSLFNPTLGNWPDLRHRDALGTSPPVPSYARAWCHGAPGIALARLRAAELDPARAETHLFMARAAITTTLHTIDKILGLPSRDASLCHGLAGLMEVALIAGCSLKDASCHERVLAAARFLIDSHARTGDWPSGLASGGPNPSLMLGLAGTGFSLLRLHDPAAIPSVLLLGAGRLGQT
jgi:hypothetical protein